MTAASFQTRAQALEDTRPLVERHDEEVAVGKATSLTGAQYNDLMTWRLAVRDTDNGAQLPAAPAFVILTV